MDTVENTITSLFDQLGLPSDEKDINAFIQKHRPLPPSVLLHEADFWSSSQAEFLKQAVREDADWASVVDVLNTRLR